MAIILCVLLMLRLGRCTDNPNVVTRTVPVGESVTLTCNCQMSGNIKTFFWIKLAAAANLPEVLGRIFNFDFDIVNGDSRITSKKERGKCFLHFIETRPTDTAFYYCLESRQFDITFLEGTFLRIKGPEPKITAITQDFPPDPVRPGDSVTLQCSLLTEKKTCPGDHSVFWFRAGSDESHPSVLYAHGNSGDECEKSPEAHSLQKCVYSFSKNISSSDAGTYYCAVASCGEILFGNGTKVDVEVVSTCDPHKDNTVVPLVCAALALSLIVTVVLVYAIRSKSCNCCNANTADKNLRTNAEAAGEINEDSVVYSTVNFPRRNAGKEGRRNAREKKAIYTDVRTFVID